LFQSMGTEQVEDFIFADIEFIENYAKEKGLSVDFLKRNIQGDIAGEGKYNIIEDFKKAKLADVKLAWDNTPKYSKDINYSAAYYTSMAKKAELDEKFVSINKQEKKGDRSIVGSQAVLKDAAGSLQFIKNQLGIPRTADMFMKKDEDGGYSYYIKKTQMPEGYTGPYDESKAVFRDQVIQKAYVVDSQGNFIPQELKIDNFDFILKEYNLY